MSETRHQAFIEASNIRPLQLAAESGVCRQALRLLRRGAQEPHVSTVAAIVRACRRLSGRPVRAADLFDLGDASKDPHHLVGVTEPRPSLPLPLQSGATRLAAFITSHGFSRADVAAASDLSKNRFSAYFHGDALLDSGLEDIFRRYPMLSYNDIRTALAFASEVLKAEFGYEEEGQEPCPRSDA